MSNEPRTSHRFVSLHILFQKSGNTVVYELKETRDACFMKVDMPRALQKVSAGGSASSSLATNPSYLNGVDTNPTNL